MKALLFSFLSIALLAQAPVEKNLVELKGAGLRVSLALQGFIKEAGEGKLSDQHTRLGMFTADAATKEKIGSSLIVSVISHDLPKGADFQKMGSVIALDKLRTNLLSQNTDDGSFLQCKRYKSPNGLYLFFIEDHNDEKSPYRLFQFYFEYINDDIWVELHMSMPTPANGAPKKGIGPVMDMVEDLIHSLKVQKA